MLRLLHIKLAMLILLVSIVNISFINSQALPNGTSNLLLNTSQHIIPYFQNEKPFELNKIQNNEECLVPCDQIVTAQVKDGIPSIDNPKFVNSNDAAAPNDGQKVIGVIVEGESRAYPYDILNWHEIVNDIINGVHVSITYCPLTGSGILYNTEPFRNATFGTSGRLYENNLIFYDRVTNTEFSQMGNFGISGEQIGTKVSISSAIETTWATWRKMNPDTVVLSRPFNDDDYVFNNPRASIGPDYNRYPYGSYRSDRSIFFKSTYNENLAPYNLYHPKKITHILNISNQILLLPFEELKAAPILNHNFNGEDLVTIHSSQSELTITYSSVVNGSSLNFAPLDPSSYSLSSDLTLGLPLFIDNTATIWNFNGLAIQGSFEGEKLTIIPTYNAFWFAASTFFYDATILLTDDFVITSVTDIENFSLNPSQDKENNVKYTSISLQPKVQEPDIVSFPNSFMFGFILLVIPIYTFRRKT